MNLRNVMRSMALVGALCLPLASSVSAKTASPAQKAAVKATLRARQANGTALAFLKMVVGRMTDGGQTSTDQLTALARLSSEAGISEGDIKIALGAVSLPAGVTLDTIYNDATTKAGNPGKENLAAKVIADTFVDANAGFFDISASEF